MSSKKRSCSRRGNPIFRTYSSLAKQIKVRLPLWIYDDMHRCVNIATKERNIPNYSFVVRCEHILRYYYLENILPKESTLKEYFWKTTADGSNIFAYNGGQNSTFTIQLTQLEDKKLEELIQASQQKFARLGYDTVNSKSTYMSLLIVDFYVNGYEIPLMPRAFNHTLYKDR